MEPYSKRPVNRSRPTSLLRRRIPPLRRPKISLPTVAVAPSRRLPAPFVVAGFLLVSTLLFVCWTIASAQDKSVVPAVTPAAAAENTRTALGAGWSLLLVLCLTLINGAFSMAETALVSLRPSRVEQLVEEKQRGALAVQRLVKNPPRFIATGQVGITLLGFASAAAAATTLSAPLIPILSAFLNIKTGTATTLAISVVTLMVAMLSMVLGEIAPKSLALQAPDRWALRLAPFISFCAVLFRPITIVVIGLSNLLVRPFGAKAQFDTPMITREEFEKMIDQGEKHGEIDDAEAKIITNVFDMSETLVRSVMTPRIDMTALPVEASLQQTLEAVITSGHSRLPVYENTIDNIVGVVHAKDLLPLLQTEETMVELRRVLRPPYFVPETRRVSELLAELRRSNQQLAIVQDEYAGTEGIVTIEDLLEEIVGEIHDEYDVDEPEVTVLSPTESLIDGRMNIDDVNDRLGTDLAHEDYDTIGGMVFGLLGHEPRPGEAVRVDNLAFTVEEVEGRRIRLVRATKMMDSKGEAENDAELEEAEA